MENNDKIKAEVIIETNNDAVLYSVMRSFLNRKSKEFNIPVDELYLQLYKENEILLLKDEDYGSGIEVLQEIEI
jgi:hypothetical protein